MELGRVNLFLIISKASQNNATGRRRGGAFFCSLLRTLSNVLQKQLVKHHDAWKAFCGLSPRQIYVLRNIFLWPVRLQSSESRSVFGWCLVTVRIKNACPAPYIFHPEAGSMLYDFWADFAVVRINVHPYVKILWSWVLVIGGWLVSGWRRDHTFSFYFISFIIYYIYIYTHTHTQEPRIESLGLQICNKFWLG